MIKKFRIILMLFMLPAILSAQFQISGKITNSENGEILSGANIIIKNTYLATSTDLKGEFVLANLKKGEYTLQITYVGFEDLVQKVNLFDNVILTLKLTPQIYLSDEVIISAIRASANSPTTFAILNEKQIEKKNTGRDLPYILESLPSTVVTSDAGAGVGYTGIRIRGTDLSRINVTLNGVPVNDAESQEVFFVDLPDLASSIDDVQVQRGVGTSTNGAAAFGASINIKSGGRQSKPYAEINTAAGSFNTLKNTLKFGSGLLSDKWAIDGRLSRIVSDGYIDRASSSLTAAQFSAGYYSKKNILKFIFINGNETTYQAWEGNPKDSLSTNRMFNPAGKIEDADGNFMGFYSDQTDNYRQTYYQLHYAHEFNDKLNLTSALFFTKGIGYYQSYKNNQYLSDYGIADTIIGGDTISTTNLIQQKWLDNGFYGFNFSLNYLSNRWMINVGVGINQYYGEHFGKVIWAQVATIKGFDQDYYSNNGLKNELNIFTKVNYNLTERINLYADLQLRMIDYRIAGTDDWLYDITQNHQFTFFNPKAGIFYQADSRNGLYLSVAVANREPNRSVFVDADPGREVLPERLIDYELGYQYESPDFSVKSNLYYMDYKNQLVMTGKINNVGSPILTNVPESYRLGLEMLFGFNFLEIFNWSVNTTFSKNKIMNFVSYTDDWTNWPQQKSDTIGTTNISFSPEMIAGSILSADPVENLRISLVSKYVSKQFIDNTSNTGRSLPAYFVNNLLFNYSIKTRLIRQIDLMLSLNNIFNTKYESNAWVYPYYENNVEYELNGFYPQAEFNFMVGLSLKF